MKLEAMLAYDLGLYAHFRFEIAIRQFSILYEMKRQYIMAEVVSSLISALSSCILMRS